MRLGIDASNIRAGGGVTHLVELLRAVDRLAYGFSQVIVWGGQGTLGNGNRKFKRPFSLNRKVPKEPRWVNHANQRHYQPSPSLGS